MTPFLIALAFLFTPFTWVVVAGVVIGAVMGKPEQPKRRAPHRLPKRHATPYLARMNTLTQIAQQKQRKTR